MFPLFPLFPLFLVPGWKLGGNVFFFTGLGWAGAKVFLGPVHAQVKLKHEPEVSLALEAHQRLVADGIRGRVVSMPSWELFDAQPQSYRDAVLPPQIQARVSIEAAAPFGWERYVGLDGAIVGVNRFGASAPGPVVMREFGFTAAQIDRLRLTPARIEAAAQGVREIAALPEPLGRIWLSSTRPIVCCLPGPAAMKN